MQINFEQITVDVELFVITLRYAAYDEDDPGARASVLAIAAAIEALWQVVEGEV